MILSLISSKKNVAEKKGVLLKLEKKRSPFSARCANASKKARRVESLHAKILLAADKKNELEELWGSIDDIYESIVRIAAKEESAQVSNAIKPGIKETYRVFLKSRGDVIVGTCDVDNVDSFIDGLTKSIAEAVKLEKELVNERNRLIHLPKETEKKPFPLWVAIAAGVVVVIVIVWIILGTNNDRKTEMAQVNTPNAEIQKHEKTQNSPALPVVATQKPTPKVVDNSQSPESAIKKPPVVKPKSHLQLAQEAERAGDYSEAVREYRIALSALEKRHGNNDRLSLCNSGVMLIRILKLTGSDSDLYQATRFYEKNESLLHSACPQAAEILKFLHDD